MTTIKVSKIDAARRQLDTAIQLYFNDFDSISIHTLTGAAHGILRNLCRKNNGGSLFDFLEKNFVRTEKITEFRKSVTKARNHFKHANSDHDFVLDFNPGINDYFIYDSCLMYQALTSEPSKYQKIFSLWFQISHLDLYNFPPHWMPDYTDYKNKYSNNKNLFFIDFLEMSHQILK